MKKNQIDTSNQYNYDENELNRLKNENKLLKNENKELKDNINNDNGTNSQ